MVSKDESRSRPAHWRVGGFFGGALLGVIVAVAATRVSLDGTRGTARVRGDDAAGDGLSSQPRRAEGNFADLLRFAQSDAFAALGEGPYEYLPNRMSVWVIHAGTGRFVNYNFVQFQRDKTKGLRSRIVTIDQKVFPPDETVYHLSDRNLTYALWICNIRTGDVQLWVLRNDGSVALDGEVSAADLGAGEFVFRPSRRSLWVVNQDSGRLASYHFKDDQRKTVLRSRVVTIDLADFPAADTDFLLSDRNGLEFLWVCNRRTGDLQLWQPKGDGDLLLAGEIETMSDLARE